MNDVEYAPSTSGAEGSQPGFGQGAANIGYALGQVLASRQVLAALKARLKPQAVLFQPSIVKHNPQETETFQSLGIRVAEWATSGRVPTRGPGGRAGGQPSRPKVIVVKPGNDTLGLGGRPSMPKLSRAVKSKANGSGRTYTSRFRGVHQTFPTRRWEAQFRRNGKPTSLGCFDKEEEAARAYDKMMLWCELHNTTGVKGGITNFDATEYESEIHRLQNMTQDELIETLRSEGRRQAAQRMMRNKRDGPADPPTEDTDASAAGDGDMQG